MRAAVGIAMTSFVVVSLVALARRDYAGHGAWMTRAYALALAAGTQAFVLVPMTFVLQLDVGSIDAASIDAGTDARVERDRDWLFR